MDPVSVTITADDNGFTLESAGEKETFASVDRALQEARGILTGQTEEEQPDEDAEEQDFEAGFSKARGMPL